jgi:V/A-type H+-transporting ATPase subunit K
MWRNSLDQKNKRKEKTVKTVARSRLFYLSLLFAIALPLVVFASLSINMVKGSVNEMAIGQVGQVPPEVYSQYGLELLAAAVAVASSCLGAGIAIYGAATAGAAAMAERPETSIWVVILAGLGEGVAIYGLLVAILILSKLPAVT